jgi:hypothetical protein
MMASPDQRKPSSRLDLPTNGKPTVLPIDSVSLRLATQLAIKPRRTSSKTIARSPTFHPGHLVDNERRRYLPPELGAQRGARESGGSARRTDEAPAGQSARCS